MKFKKIILIFSIWGIIILFLPHPISAEKAESPFEPTKPEGKCNQDTDCPTNQFCEDGLDKDSTIVANYSHDCVPQLENNKACNRSRQCKTNFCGYAQGGAKQCMEPDTGAGYLKFAPIAPTLEIKIPTLQPFTTEGLEKPDAEGNIYFPFIGQYIVGIYKWMLLIAGIVATIMIILGGFTYLTSGGNATQAGQGKERITNAIFGLILLLGSYMLLYLINPGLVEFRSLKIKVVEREDLKMPPENESITPGSFDFAANGITKPTWDENTFDCNKKDTYQPMGVVSKTALATYTCDGIEGNITTIKQMQAPLCKAGAIAKSKGYTISIPGGGWRSFEQQVENWCVSGLKNYWDVKERKKYNAVPGFSNHGTGVAVDAYLKQDGKNLTNPNSKTQCQNNDPAWVEKIAEIFYAADNNFLRLESEIWHFEFGTSGADKTRGKYMGMPKKCGQ
jgi:hypothetical protein